MTNKPYFLALNRVPFVGPKTVLKLLSIWPNLKDCFNLSPSTLQEAGLPIKLATAIHQFDWESINPDLAFENKPNQTLLTWDDPRYPPLLKEIHDPPPVLYAKGDLTCLTQQTLAIVGTRHPSSRGRHIAYQWAKELTEHSLSLASGLAQGIDAAVHEGCLAAHGKTIAVLGTGIDVVYPKQNQKLAMKIAETGLLLSEFPLKTSPKAGHFPRRNRIISGLSMATLVIEATLRSGSLITARFALEQNRSVLALPGSIDLPQTKGCHHLIKQGARMVTEIEEVLDELALPYLAQTAKPSTHDSSLPETKVLEWIGETPVSVDALVTRSGLTVREITAHLVQLEMAGVVHAVLGGYTRCSSPS